MKDASSPPLSATGPVKLIFVEDGRICQTLSGPCQWVRCYLNGRILPNTSLLGRLNRVRVDCTSSRAASVPTARERVRSYIALGYFVRGLDGSHGNYIDNGI